MKISKINHPTNTNKVVFKAYNKEIANMVKALDKTVPNESSKKVPKIFTALGLFITSALAGMFNNDNSPDGIEKAMKKSASGVTTKVTGGCEYIYDKNGTLRMKIYKTGEEQIFDENGVAEATILPLTDGTILREDEKTHTFRNFDKHGHELK